MNHRSTREFERYFSTDRPSPALGQDVSVMKLFSSSFSLGQIDYIVLSGAPLKVRLLALPTNIGQGWKKVPGTNALAYYENLKLTAIKSFITLATGTFVVKLFTAVIYDCSK